MNIVYEAILQNKHKLETEGMHTWREFSKVASKKLYLFGATASSRYFLDRYGQRFFVCAVLDNDVNKQNEYFYKETFVQSPSVLGMEDLNHVVVIVTVTNYYVEICNQLREMGVRYCFVLCKMEQARLSTRAYISSIFFKRRISLKVCQFLEQKTGWNKIFCYRKRILKQCWKFPVIQKKIVFIAQNQCIDHEKYICRALLALNKDLDLVWVLRDAIDCPKGARYVDARNQRQVLYELATAKVWLNRDNFPIYIKKRKNQIYIQTKHWSSVTLKKFFFDTPIFCEKQPWVKYLWYKERKMFDYIIVGSEFDRKTCESGFKYHGKYACIGSPRTDALFKSELYKSQIYNKYQIEENIHIALYAPTFRVSQSNGRRVDGICNVVPDFSKLVTVLKEKFGGSWKIGLRLHPYVSDHVEKLQKSDCVVNMSQYDDVQELLAMSDVIITDYSSLMFEPAMVGKKVFLFTPDLDKYLERERGLWFDIRDLPFSYAINEDTLYRKILEFDEEIYQNAVKTFFESLGVTEDGHASERAAEFILNLLEG